MVADNPAAMHLLEGRQLQGDLTMINYSIDFSGGGYDASKHLLSGSDGGDAGRIGWAWFDEANLDFSSPQPNESTHFDCGDTSFGAIGAEYKVSNAIALRSGIAYNQSPVTRDVRDARVPDTDRNWVLRGATWRESQAVEYSVGYTHLFARFPQVDLTTSTDGTLSGEFDVAAALRC